MYKGYTISVLLQKKMSRTFIAQVITVSTSTISREVVRNSNFKGVYDPRQAELYKSIDLFHKIQPSLLH